MLKTAFWILSLMILLSFVNAKLIPVDPCAGESTAYNVGSVYYLNSTCYLIDFDQNYNQPFQFQDKVNNEFFTLKLFYLTDVNVANPNQRQVQTFASMLMTPAIEGNAMTYTSSDGKVKLTYQIQGSALKAGIEVWNWTSAYPQGRLQLRTMVHKGDYGSHFESLPAVVDGIEQPMQVSSEIQGQNEFIVQTLFEGNSFSHLVQDPLYVVDYSPIPGEWLIEGDAYTDDNTAFSQIIDITTNISDNISTTYAYINPYELLLPSLSGFKTAESSYSTLTYTLHHNYTFNVIHPGDYYIFGSIMMAYAKADRPVSVLVQVDGAWAGEFRYIPKSATSTQHYEEMMYHTVKTMSAGSHNIKVYVKAHDTSTFLAKNSRILLLHPDEYYTTYSNTSIAGGAGSWIPVQELIFSPNETGAYTIVVSGDYMQDDKDKSVYVLYTLDGVAIDDVNFDEGQDANDRDSWRPYYFVQTVNLTAHSTHNVTVSCQHETSASSMYCWNKRISVFRVYGADYVDSDLEFTTTNTSFQTPQVNSITVTDPGEYNIIAYAQISSYSTTGTVITRMTVDGTPYCEERFRPYTITASQDDMPWTCNVRLNLSVGVHNSTIQYSSLAGQQAYITNLRQVFFHTSYQRFQELEKAIDVKFLATYNSTYNYYLVIRKHDYNDQNISILAHSDNDSVSTINETFLATTQATYVTNVTALMDYMLNNASMPNSQFRIASDQYGEISEVYLLEITDDTTNPTISDCNINTTTFGCNDEVELSCLVSDDIGVGNVYFTVNGTNHTASAIGWNFSYPFSTTGEDNTTYHWSDVFAFDLVDNPDTYMPNLSMSYYCCLENWVQYSGSCQTNDSYMVYYLDSKNCNNPVDEVPVPGDNGTYSPCNYCSESLLAINFGTCFYNGTESSRNFTWTDTNYFGCCAITGLVSDCSILYSPYNDTDYEACHVFESDFMIDMDEEVYFDFGWGGLDESDKVFGKIYINNTNYTNMTFACISFVETIENKVVQTNPPYTKRIDTLVSWTAQEIEDREFFVTRNGLANVYWTGDKLIIDGREYIFGVDCASEEGVHLVSEVGARVFYEGLNQPITRWFWLRDNLTAIGLALILTISIILIAAWVYKGVWRR